MDYATWEPYLHSLYVSPYPPFPYQMTYWKEGRIDDIEHHKRGGGHGYARGRGGRRSSGRGRGRSSGRGRGYRTSSFRGRGGRSRRGGSNRDKIIINKKRDGPTYRDIVANVKVDLPPKKDEEPKPSSEWGDIE